MARQALSIWYCLQRASLREAFRAEQRARDAKNATAAEEAKQAANRNDNNRRNADAAQRYSNEDKYFVLGVCILAVLGSPIYGTTASCQVGL